MAKWTVVCDDVLHWAETYSGPKFHAMLTDSPYELNFMSKSWDRRGISFRPETWAALAEHLLPGAHILAFGGDRTHHRLMCAIEDAGLEIRTCLYWAFGSGFPKSLNVGKAIDKAAGAEREVVGRKEYADGTSARMTSGYVLAGEHLSSTNGKGNSITAPATPAAATWEGYGTALKPAVEVIVVARKPVEGTVVGNCQRYGSGALNIDESRIAGSMRGGNQYRSSGNGRKHMLGVSEAGKSYPVDNHPLGRWPANLLLDDSEAVAGLFPANAGDGSAKPRTGRTKTIGGNGIYQGGVGMPTAAYGDSGSAARFFYQADWSLDQAEQLDAADVLRYTAKASRSERNFGVEDFYWRKDGDKYTRVSQVEWEQLPKEERAHGNFHCTVKPLTLCKYLASLILPPPAYAPRRILIPFGGVMSEACGAGLAGWDEIVAVESERSYCDLGEARLAYWLRQPELALR